MLERVDPDDRAQMERENKCDECCLVIGCDVCGPCGLHDPTNPPGRTHPAVARLTAAQREELASAIATVDQHLLPASADRFYELRVREGWIMGCEDCDWNLGVDEQGRACANCGHVNGDPSTGSTPDDIPMRVCEPCWENQHALCDGVGRPEDDEDLAYCNCARLGHPPVTVAKP